MFGRPHHSHRKAVVWAAGLSLALTALSGGAVQAQNQGPPPAPRLPPPPSVFGFPPNTSPQSRDCGVVDWACRIDRLERRVADLEREADRDDRSGMRDRGRGGRSVDTTVDRDCMFDSCAVMASKLCADAGFARGVPIEVRQNGSWQRLVRATCVD